MIEISGRLNSASGSERRGRRGDPRGYPQTNIEQESASHGDATEEGLTQRAARFTEREQVLSAVGVGLDFNEYVMSRLADACTGNYYYLESSVELAPIFAKEFSATKSTVARGVVVTLKPGDGVDVVDQVCEGVDRAPHVVV